MAEIQPFRAWRYGSPFSSILHTLICPLFDVVSHEQREKLYCNPHNSIHISPSFGKNNDLHTPENTLEDWKRKNIIVQDKLPGIYIYYRYFKPTDSDKIHCQKGFIAHIRTYCWEDKVVLRHEHTMPKVVKKLTESLEASQLYTSATHGLYTDKRFTLETWMDEAISNPIYEVDDDQGMKNILAVIHDEQVIKLFIDTLLNKQIILADGHHRYQGAIDYRKMECARNPTHHGKEGYNFHLMYFSNTESADLRVMPTHRLLVGLKSMQKKDMLHHLNDFFDLTPVNDPTAINKAIMGKPHTFGLLFAQKAYIMSLKPECLDKITWEVHETIKQLDVTLVHYFIFEEILRIPREQQQDVNNIEFEPCFTQCLKRTKEDESIAAIIMQEIPIEKIKQVCRSGHVMPQKSTYFYPKTVCGLLFSSIKEDEFSLFAYPSLR